MPELSLALLGPPIVERDRARVTFDTKKAVALLAPPLSAFLLVYVSALAVLFISAFWTVNQFTGNLDLAETFADLPMET